MSRIFQDALQRAGLTQKQFADILNKLSGCTPITRQRVSHWANKKSRPQEAAIALAVILSKLAHSELTKILEQL